jgi:tetratricopeptide (TPR) repeat protein
LSGFFPLGDWLASLQESLQNALGHGYRLEKELGGGGMSRVFLAEEVELGRKVVIKVLPPEMGAGVNVDRFRREIQLAARLQHPHIVPLLTAGASGDLLYYVMPFIEGESLRAKLARERELPIPEALRILRDVLDALAYAHGHQVVHRDIKPDNVLLSGQHALVTDFGVAKAVAESTGKQTLTSLGVALGTPAYMAPEQATADPYTDHRADIYALGAMAYEMVSGRPPFMALNAQAMLAAHVTEAPEPVTKHRATVPPALNEMILRCLQKKPADRWQRADELIPQVAALLTPTGGTTPTGTQPVISSGTEAAIARAHPVRVAGPFGLASVGVLAIVYAVVRLVGLPDWVFWGAIALLAIGLPIMLLTSHHERRRALARSSGHMTATPAGGLAPHFTWRKALLGGGIAFASLGVVSAGYMAMRVVGIGPFATLVSAGVLGARDPLVLADFANRTSDSTLGASITEALRIDLSQSPVVRVLESSVVADALGRMLVDRAAPVTEDVARDLAVREGVKAIVAGEVAPLGSGYVLTVRLVSAADGTTLLAGREEAFDASQIIGAVERLSRKLRSGIGESLRTIRAAQPLEQVTTTSLAALRLYSDGFRANIETRPRDAVRLLEQAVALDSNFGMAWRTLGVALGNIGLDPARSRSALTRAFELRHRMPPREALHAEAYPYFSFLNDKRRAIALYERLLVTWPDDEIALANLAITYYRVRRPADAERLLARSVALYGAGLDFFWLANSQVALGRLAAAETTLAEWARRAAASPARMATVARLAREQQKLEQTFAHVDSLLSSQSADARGQGFIVARETYTLIGRLQEAERGMLQQMEGYERSGEVLGYLLRSLDLATSEAVLLGRPEDAVRRVQDALARHPPDSLPPPNRPYGNLAGFFAAAGRADLAQAMLSAFARVAPDSIRNANAWTPFTAALLALLRKDGRTALSSLDRAQELFGCLICVDLQRGQAYELLSQPDSAIRMYERVANTPSLGIEARQYQLPVALRRLGELYGERDDRERALEYYGRFVDLWKNADPELQPLVSEARERMARLVGERR